MFRNSTNKICLINTYIKQTFESNIFNNCTLNRWALNKIIGFFEWNIATLTTITHITHQFQVGAAQPEANPHVFRQYFEDLVIGDTVFTHKHTVTDADIVNFANVSGDNFYAHMDATSLDGTIFEQRVAHGYFILSKAAGLFVDPKKGPVLLNYGVEEARFVKPVYPGATIGVRFTVKEKIDQEKRSEDDIAKGIVKFLVDVYDETGETVALATILTMVKKIDQSS